MKKIIDKICEEKTFSTNELLTLLENHQNPEISLYLKNKAIAIRKKYYGNKIYIRGLIEISNYCKNDCYYCGIRSSNKNIKRYRLTYKDVLNCCKAGYELGFRTFVLQGGEDRVCDDYMLEIIKAIRKNYPDCAITLSLGEKSQEAYLNFFKAGANRYLLRHEAADKELYSKLHPKNLNLDTRLNCLHILKEIGYQTGSGFMVGAPYQTNEDLVLDLLYLWDIKPQMIGIGPFIPHKDTKFATNPAGSLKLTLFLISLLRIMHPKALIPSTTALRTLDENGHKLGIGAGANVIMPNLSPDFAKENYTLYNNIAYSGDESASMLYALKKEMKEIGYEIVVDRGDVCI